jgi:hypothetical protein
MDAPMHPMLVDLTGPANPKQKLGDFAKGETPVT